MHTRYLKNSVTFLIFDYIFLSNHVNAFRFNVLMLTFKLIIHIETVRAIFFHFQSNHLGLLINCKLYILRRLPKKLLKLKFIDLSRKNYHSCYLKKMAHFPLHSKNLRVDFTRRRVIENKTMRVESTHMRVVKKKQQQQQKQKVKHGAGACRSKIYVFYDEFKLIF
jgi:hypothetical protein